MTADEIHELLEATTTMYRKGEAIERQMVGNVAVTHVWLDTPGMDAIPDDAEHLLVDVHFFVVGIDRAAAEAHRDEFEQLVAEWPPDPTYMPENRLDQGPSYIELGAQIGTFMGQQDALLLMALGEVLGAWHVITPRRLLPGISDDEADRMAGGGLVMIGGYKSEEAA